MHLVRHVRVTDQQLDHRRDFFGHTEASHWNEVLHARRNVSLVYQRASRKEKMEGDVLCGPR